MSEQGNTAGKDAFQAEFEALPLDEKFSRLFKMEIATLGETFRKVEESSAKVFEKVGEAMSDFGRKVDSEFKKAACGEKAEAEASSPAGEGTSSHEEGH